MTVPTEKLLNVLDIDSIYGVVDNAAIKALDENSVSSDLGRSLYNVSVAIATLKSYSDKNFNAGGTQLLAEIVKSLISMDRALNQHYQHYGNDTTFQILINVSQKTAPFVSAYRMGTNA